MTSITCHPYDALSKDTLYAILQLRSTVFVLEQGCVYQDVDGKDAAAHHCLLEENGVLLGYCRILPPAIKHEYPAIGRYALLPEARGKGLGRALFHYAIEQTRTRHPNHPIYIQAQHYLHSFYSRFGFTQVGDIYDEAGIPHVDMVLGG